MISIIIPFAGFYNSLHSELLDDAENQIFQDGQGNLPDYAEKLQEKFFSVCEYRHAHVEYSNAYTEAFAEKIGIKTLKFEALDSPKEYNFTTDCIFCTLDPVEVFRLFNETTTPTLRVVARENHTSRDGFCSFYDSEFETWGDVATWDHNQLSTLLQAWMLDNFDDYHDGGAWTQWDEYDLMSDHASNGAMDNWLCKAPRAARVACIASYLRERAARG
jgi:hypothetical protein